MDNKETLPSTLHASLVARQRSQERSHRRYQFHYGVTALALAAVFLPNNLAWFFILFACMLQIAALSLKIQATYLHLLSRDAQRLALLSDSLGHEVLTFDVVDIHCDLELSSRARQVRQNIN